MVGHRAFARIAFADIQGPVYASPSHLLAWLLSHLVDDADHESNA
jgi:hypothetical protein